MKTTNNSESKEYRMRFTATGSAVETMEFIKTKFGAQMLTRAVQLAVEAYFDPSHKNPLFEALGVTQTAPVAKQPKIKAAAVKATPSMHAGAIVLNVDEMLIPRQVEPVVKSKRTPKKLPEGITLNVEQMF